MSERVLAGQVAELAEGSQTEVNVGGVSVVVGTTGWDDAKLATLRAQLDAAPGVGVLIAPPLRRVPGHRPRLGGRLGERHARRRVGPGRTGRRRRHRGAAPWL